MSAPPPLPPPVMPYSGPPLPETGGGPPCPKCGHRGHKPVSFTWWGGLIGPKMLSHVKCNACQSCFNGKTGRPNTTGIVIYTVVGCVIGIVVFVLLVVARS